MNEKKTKNEWKKLDKVTVGPNLRLACKRYEFQRLLENLDGLQQDEELAGMRALTYINTKSVVSSKYNK